MDGNTALDRSGRPAPGTGSAKGFPMFDKILITNHGDQPPKGGAAAQPNRSGAARRWGDFAAEIQYV
mgnify:CR=1 FL=1